MIILKRKFRKSKAYHSLSEAVKVAGKKRCTLIIEGDVVVKSDITIPKNIKLIKLSGGFFNVAKNKILKIENFCYPLIQIFKGFGEQGLEGKYDIHPEWWG